MNDELVFVLDPLSFEDKEFDLPPFSHVSFPSDITILTGRKILISSFISEFSNERILRILINNFQGELISKYFNDSFFSKTNKLHFYHSVSSSGIPSWRYKFVIK